MVQASSPIASGQPAHIPTQPVAPQQKPKIEQVIRDTFEDTFEPDEVAGVPATLEETAENIEAKGAEAAGFLSRTWKYLTKTAGDAGSQFAQAARLVGNAVVSAGQSLIGYLLSFADRGNKNTTANGSAPASDSESWDDLSAGPQIVQEVAAHPVEIDS